MEKKDYIQTLRLTEKEWGDINHFLKLNPLFDSFSSLARIALRSFLKQKNILETIPLSERPKESPYFLWDYDLSEEQVQEMLATQSFDKKKWLIARILESARFEDVWKYLTLGDIQKALPHLRMNPKKKAYWSHAIKIWS